MDEQEQQNQQDSFLKQQGSKAKDKLKDDIKKKSKQGLKKLFKILPLPVKVILISIVGGISILLFLVMAFYVVKKGGEDKTNSAAENAVSTTYSSGASITGTDADGNELSQVALSINESKTGYEIVYNKDDEYIQSVRGQMESGIVNSASDFNDYEIAVLGALMENGADLDYYTEEELHCLPEFVKAEACTQNLDLRKNSEKQSGKGVGDYIDNYQPKKIENLSENEIPGVILVQRTNTNTNTPITLEYKIKSEFDALVTSNNKDAINYFTITDDGNIIIAKWDHILITVDGDYPQSLDESEKDMPKDENIITTEEIPYNQYITKYEIPFEFLTQLLVITEDPDFCMELVDYVLNSKIVINIQEEEKVTITDETRNYTVHNRNKKNAEYNVKALEQQIVSDNYAFNYAKDDEQNDCTNYTKSDLTVKVHTEYTSHSYAFEIVEIDTWITHLKKTYSKQSAITQPEVIDNLESYGEYKEISNQDITDEESIKDDKDVNTFIKDTEKKYDSKITVPNVNIKDFTDEDGNNFKDIKVENGSKEGKTRYAETIDDEGNKTGEYNLPKTITVKSKKVNSTSDTKEIPELTYSFELKKSKSIFGKVTYKYELKTNIDPLTICTVSKLNIKEDEKLDLKLEVKTTTTDYPADSNPITEKHYYAIDDNGNFEKFLVALKNNEEARNNLNSIESWLYEMMEERENTVELVDVVKYLLYIYDGKSRGVTELELEVFDTSEFTTFNSGTGWWWPIGSSNVETINGIEFAKGEPVSSNITSGVGPRWGKNHGGIDISNGIRGTNIIASKAGTVIKVVDGYGDGYYGSTDGNGYGNNIRIQHDDGTYSIYAHLEKGTIKVSEGDRVEQGQLLGEMGTSGSSTGIHLHFEIRDANDNKLDPEEYVDPENPRPTNSSETLRDWLWNLEGGSQYINGTSWTVFNPGGRDNTMNLAHGMVVASYDGADSWYPDIIPGKITAGQTVTEEQAYKVWEKKIKGFNDAIDSSCAKYGVTLTANQKDALVSYIYRTGYGKGQNNELVSAYKNGGNAGLWNYMKNGYDKRSEYEVGTKRRVAEEYELFVKGDYSYDSSGTTKYDQYCNNPNI